MDDETYDLVMEILELVKEMIDEGEHVPDEYFDELEEFLALFPDVEKTPQSPPQRPETPVNEPIAPEAELIWILAGEDPEAFASYLETIDDPELNALARNPERLARVIEQLGERISFPIGESSEGIPRASLQSSNVYGFQYDPNSEVLRIKFQGNDGLGQGPVYEYEGVPPRIFKIMRAGAVPAKTSGENKWGKWWEFKQPSLGAAVNALIVKGGYEYRKVS